MSYITNTDIENRLGTATYLQLADDDGDGSADVVVVDEARLGAEGEINSYLARRYRVPIDLTVHAELRDVLTSVTLDLVEFRLRSRRPPVPEHVIRMRDGTLDWLRRVADGGADLPSTSQVSANPSRGTVASSTGEDRLLSREELSDH